MIENYRISGHSEKCLPGKIDVLCGGAFPRLTQSSVVLYEPVKQGR